MKTIGKELLLFLPKDFLDFIKPFHGKDFDIFFKSHSWNFWNIDKIKNETALLINKGLIGASDIVFANNVDGQHLFFRNGKYGLNGKLYLLEPEGEWMFYAFSMGEIENFDTAQKLIKEIKRVGFENQELTPLSDCIGSTFNYAYELYSSQFDASYSLERNKKALELFEELAEKGHLGAAHELAVHYYFEDDFDLEAVVKWYEKAISLGSIEDVFALVDLILEEDIEEKDRAIKLLESLLDVTWHKGRASLKLSRIYMSGDVIGQDLQKGLHFAELSAASGNYNALSDLAFYYYEGKGVEKDLQKAHELLVLADRKITENVGEGIYNKEIRMFEEQMNMQST